VEKNEQHKNAKLYTSKLETTILQNTKNSDFTVS